MNRLDQTQAAAQRTREIAEERSRKMVPAAKRPSQHQRQKSREFASALGGYDAFLAVKAERLAAQAGTTVDSPETAISDAIDAPAHMLTE
ncbi:hypothetical protein AB0P00_13580 [Microbacterium sp. NPDC077057]|uniref:hypothetical protein n=1 Tax=Microbacterium sp. NPDC077057 TaxID=3154763 RepID=UPI003440B625